MNPDNQAQFGPFNCKFEHNYMPNVNTLYCVKCGKQLIQGDDVCHGTDLDKQYGRGAVAHVHCPTDDQKPAKE